MIALTYLEARTYFYDKIETLKLLVQVTLPKLTVLSAGVAISWCYCASSTNTIQSFLERARRRHIFNILEYYKAIHRFVYPFRGASIASSGLPKVFGLYLRDDIVDEVQNTVAKLPENGIVHNGFSYLGHPSQALRLTESTAEDARNVSIGHRARVVSFSGAGEP